MTKIGRLILWSKNNHEIRILGCVFLCLVAMMIVLSVSLMVLEAVN